MICHQEEAQPEVGAKGRDLGGPDFCHWHAVGSWLFSFQAFSFVFFFSAKEIRLIFALLSRCDMKYVLTEMF